MRKRFVDEYILHEGNATEAYLAAGYKTKRKNAESSASRLLKEEVRSGDGALNLIYIDINAVL